MFSGLSNIITYLSAGDFRGLIIYLLALMLGMLVAISFHEWAHAFAAYKLGDPTAKNMGRMTLDPTKHIDPIGAVCFLLFGMGWAHPVIVNSRNLKNYRRDDLIISLAGPVMNLLLSFIFFGGYFFASIYTDNEVLHTVLLYLVSLNMSFAIFNILPIPPLDGFRVVTSIFVRKGHKVVEVLQRYGWLILMALLLTGVIGRIMEAIWGVILPLFIRFYSLFI